MFGEEVEGDGVKKDEINFFFCLNEGCVKMYERYSSLENMCFLVNVG